MGTIVGAVFPEEPNLPLEDPAYEQASCEQESKKGTGKVITVKGNGKKKVEKTKEDRDFEEKEN